MYFYCASENLPVDRAARHLEPVGDAKQTLRVAYEQITIDGQHVSEPVEQFLLHFLVEIDDHVAAKNYIERPTHGPVVLEVQLAEAYALAQFGHDTDQIG